MAVSLTLLTPVGALLSVGVLIPLAALLLARRRARRVRSTLDMSEPPRRGVVVALASLLTAGVLLGLAATQPIVEQTKTLQVRTDAEAFVVVDVSRSMLAQRDAGSAMRIVRAKRAASELRASLGGVPVGVASLTDRVLPHLFPSADEDVFEATLERSIGIERPPPGGTFRTRATKLDALASVRGLHFFSPKSKQRLLIVLTDGETVPVNRARLAAQLLRVPAIDTVFVQVWSEGESVYTRNVAESQYVPDPGARAVLDGVAEAINGSVYSEQGVDSAARKAHELIGNGPTVVKGERHSPIALAPYLSIAAFLPLALLLSRRDR
ncbi:MAG: vWA domain-containing protein [Gaiellaceae bacterium]